MEHQLSITWVVGERADKRELRSLVTTVVAEIDKGPSPQRAFPDSLDGKLVGITRGLRSQLKFGRGVDVVFSGKAYKFSRLENDGTFELRKDSHVSLPLTKTVTDSGR
jgi:hypothetical protein